MAVLVIAGSGRGAGKTAVGCALIAAMPEWQWVAVKISPHAHQVPEAGLIWEETDRGSDKDTERYLAAGAAQAFLVSGVHDDDAQTALAAIRRTSGAGSLLVESNQVVPALVAQAAEPTLTLAIVAGPQSNWKPSIWPRLDSADAVVLSAGLTPDQLSPKLHGKRIFCLPRGQWMSPELRMFVRESLRV